MLLHQRLYNQHLIGAPLAKPEEVVRRLGAVQSQDYLGAKWSVGQRLRNGTDAGVERAFVSGRILRTHVLRPTWHFVTPDDIRWMLALTAPRGLALNAYQYKRLELDRAVLARSQKLFAHALRDGTELTRAELACVLGRAGIVASGQRLAYITMHAELTGLVCSGAVRGSQHTYALLEDRAPNARVLSRDAALAELTYRFFAGHAPATLIHLVWWSGLLVADARAGLAMVRQRLTRDVRNGTEWFGVPRRPATQAELVAILLPEYDEALVGARDMAVPDLPPTHRGARPEESFVRPIIIDGMRVGTWRRTIQKRALVIEARLFAALSPAQSKALITAAERYGAFLGLPVTLA